jgi:Fe2+-dicitrate sensor, membrane component
MKKKTLYHFFAGSASDTEKEAIKNWLEKDISHQKELLKERAFFDAVLLADENQKAVKNNLVHKFRYPVQQIIKWAAVIAITVLSSYLFFNTGHSTNETTTNTITVPPGQRVNLSLSDGTNVYLNSGSTFTYPSFFSDNARKVKLDGEAFFEVSKNKEKPFVVQTQSCDIEVLGTKFNVDAYSDENSFSAALIEGAIKVKNNNYPSNVIQLKPYHKTTLHNGKLIVSNISDYGIYRWKDGLICFEDLNFVELMKRLEKYYGIDIPVQNTSLSQHAFSGTFRMSDGVENILRILQKDIGYQYIRSEDGNTIYIK